MSQHCWGGKIAHTQFSLYWGLNLKLQLVTLHTQWKNMLNSHFCVFVSLPYMTRVFSCSAVIKWMATNLQPTAGSFHNSHAECLGQRCVEENMTLHKNSTNIFMLQSPQKTHPRGHSNHKAQIIIAACLKNACLQAHHKYTTMPSALSRWAVFTARVDPPVMQLVFLPHFL